MSETATLGIIRDLLALAGIALALGLAVYAVMRAAGGPPWNCDGNVLARPYGWPDGVSAVLILAFMSWNITAEMPPEAQPATGAAGQSPELVLLATIVIMLVLTFCLLTYMRIRRLEPGEMFGLRQMTLARAVWVGALAFAVVMVAVAGVMHLIMHWIFGGQWPDMGTQEPVAVFQEAKGPLKILLALAMIVVVPIYEETVFRGFLYGAVKRFSDRWFAAIFTSLVFACVHRFVGGLVPLFVLAIGFAVAYEMTGCLLVPVFMHAFFNGWQTLAIILAE